MIAVGKVYVLQNRNIFEILKFQMFDVKNIFLTTYSQFHAFICSYRIFHLPILIFHIFIIV